MTEYVEKNGLDDAEGVVDYAYALSTKYGEASAALACQMYDQTAEAAGAGVPPAEPAATASYAETRGAVESAQQQSALPQMVGDMVGLLVKRAASDTTLKNALRDGAQFAWIPSGDGCPFCRMIASRGWVYASKKTIRGDHAEHIHRHCQCEFAIRFSERDSVAGYHPEELRKQYDAAEGSSWREKLRSMDREHYAENRDAINARKKIEYAERTRMPGRDSAFIPEAKITEYLLKEGAKHTQEFLDAGYTFEDAKQLADDIIKGAKSNKAQKLSGNFYGGRERYSVKTMLGKGENKKPFDTVWQIVDGKPVLITAHRVKGDK